MASTLAERIRSVREARGIGVAELDRLADASRGSTSRIESGKRTGIGPEMVDKYARALGVSHEWLARGTGPQQPASPDAIPAGANLPALRSLLAVVAGDTDPNLVRHFWERAAEQPESDTVSPLEWAERFVLAWMSANKPRAPRTKVTLDPSPGKAHPMDEAIGRLAEGRAKKVK